MTDPIADMLTRIRNGYGARLKVVRMPYSKLKEALADVLVAESFLAEKTVEVVEKHKQLVLNLRYVEGEPALSKIQRASKPGRREYLGYAHLKAPLSGYGFSILSTSKGLMTDKAARKAHLGGEILCRVY